MDEEKSTRLLLRQLKDIQAQADNIERGENSVEAIENFSRYSRELKQYILTKVNNDAIKKHCLELPEINYSRAVIKLWHYLLLPWWAIAFFRDYRARTKLIEQIKQSRSKYATLEILIKSIA